MRSLTLSLLFLVGSGASASAQRGPAQAPVRPEHGEQVEQGEIEPPPLTLKFDVGDEVEGTLARPDDTRVDVLKRLRHTSLIRSRMSFLPEMLATTLNH